MKNTSNFRLFASSSYKTETKPFKIFYYYLFPVNNASFLDEDPCR